MSHEPHPLFAAIDAAIVEHGWPEGCKHIGMETPLWTGSVICAVVMGKPGDVANQLRGQGDTLGAALADADRTVETVQ